MTPRREARSSGEPRVGGGLGGPERSCFVRLLPPSALCHLPVFIEEPSLPLLRGGRSPIVEEARRAGGLRACVSFCSDSGGRVDWEPWVGPCWRVEGWVPVSTSLLSHHQPTMSTLLSSRENQISCLPSLHLNHLGTNNNRL